MVRKIAVLVAGLLLLIPASALARNDNDKERAGSAVMLAEGDVDAPVYNLTIDVPARETGRERHD